MQYEYLNMSYSIQKFKKFYRKNQSDQRRIRGLCKISMRELFDKKKSTAFGR